MAKPKERRKFTGRSNLGGLMSGIGGASSGDMGVAANQLVPDDISGVDTSLPIGYAGPQAQPYLGPQQYYAPDGSIVETPYQDTRGWMARMAGRPNIAGQANLQIQQQIAQNRALAPLEIANSQRMMQATEDFTQKNAPNELARQKAKNDLETQSRLAQLSALNTQGQDVGTTAIPNVGFNSKNPGDVDYRFAGNPDEILDQPFIPYGEGVRENQKYAQQNIANRINEQAFNDRPIVNPLSLGDGSGSPYNNRFMNTTPGGIEANAKMEANRLANARLNRPEIQMVGDTLVAVDPATQTVKRLAAGNAGKVVEGFDFTTGKPNTKVVGQSFQNYSPKPVANAYRSAPAQPLEIDGGNIAQKYSGQTQEFLVPTEGDTSSKVISQGGAPKTEPNYTPQKVAYPRIMPGRSSGGRLMEGGNSNAPLELESQPNAYDTIKKLLRNYVLGLK